MGRGLGRGGGGVWGVGVEGWWCLGGGDLGNRAKKRMIEGNKKAEN